MFLNVVPYCVLTCSSSLPGLYEQTYVQSDTSYPQLSPCTSAPDLPSLAPTDIYNGHQDKYYDHCVEGRCNINISHHVPCTNMKGGSSESSVAAFPHSNMKPNRLV